MLDPLANTQCSSSQYDYVIVGSGFGGSVSAYRLASKGYKVLVVEKGRRYAGDRFAKTNWNLRKWLWMPALGLKGIMQVVPPRHVTAMSGVGVGGGSLVYGATLPRPKVAFFESGSWAGLADWKNELAEHYDTAEQMLGATENPRLTSSDRVMEQLAKDLQLNGSPMQIGAGLLHVGDRLGYFGTDFELPSYTTTRMFVAYDVTPNLKIRADIDNLFDEEFYVNSFSELWEQPGAPRTWRISARVSF